MNENRQHSSSGVPMMVGFGVFIVVVCAAALITFAMPELFASTARVRANANLTNQAAMTPGFMETECEVIRSEAVLAPVIEKLDLNTVWGKQYSGGARLKTSEALLLLKRTVEVRSVRNTELIEIRVLNEKPEQAALIANTIAESYKRTEANRRLRISELNPGLISDPVVSIVDRATPSVKPARPNKPLNLFIGVMLGIVMSLAAGIGMKALTERKPPPT